MAKSESGSLSGFSNALLLRRRSDFKKNVSGGNREFHSIVAAKVSGPRRGCARF